MPVKLTPKQRQTLISAYIAKGRAATLGLCAEYGVHPDYPADLTRKANLYRDQPRSLVRRSRAKMWARAVANGPVMA